MGEPIPNDQDFTIAGEGVRCPHPRATGQPAHDINCGCTTLSRFPNDSLKAVLHRYASRGFLTYEQLTKRERRDGERSDTHA